MFLVRTLANLAKRKPPPQPSPACGGGGRRRLFLLPPPQAGEGWGGGAAVHHHYSAAIAAGENAGSAARSLLAIGCGHQRSSHSANRSASCGITFSAKSLVLYLARSLFMLPNCRSNMRWPTLRFVATSRSCA